MNGIKTHIAGKFTAIILAMMMLLPTTVKIFHAFENYKHEVCTSKGAKHIHQIDHDCLFYKFHLNNHFTIQQISYQILDIPEISLEIPTDYQFLSEYQNLHFALRGPPGLI